MDFWNRLRNELDYQGITHKELADKIWIIKGSLESKFARENTPDADFLYKCSKALNLTMDYLYTGKIKDSITDEDIRLIKEYHQLSDHDKKVFKAILSTMNKVAAEITPDDTNYVFVEK